MELPVLYKMDSVQTDYSCPICIQTVNNPVLLPGCGHNVCLECLQDLYSSSGSGSRVACPQCRVKSDVPSNNINNLPKNLVLEIALQKLNLSKNPSLQKSETEVCPDHKQPLILMCMEHNELCCIICAQFGDHQGHSIKDLKNAKEDIQVSLKELYEKASKKKNQAEGVLQRYEQLRQEASEHMNQHVESINSAYSNLLQKVEELHKQRIQEASLKFDEFYQQLEQEKEKFKPLLLDIENLVSNNTDILTQIKYKENLQSMKDLKIQDPSNLEIFISSNYNADHIFKTIQDLGEIKMLKVGPGKSFILLDPNKKSTNISLQRSGLKMQKTGGSEFNTVLSSEPFYPGKVYQWYMKLLAGNYFKIGVSKMYNDFEHAFSDFSTGWAWYVQAGALRHNSNGSGANYGSRCEVNDIVGVTFDTIEGTLSFQKNGSNLGVAYTEEQFKTGEFYAAFSCLHNQDCLELVDPEGNQLQTIAPSLPLSFLFVWDPEQSYNEFTYADQNRKVTFIGCSTYRTVMASPSLQAGKIYRWKLQLNEGNDYKIGVSKMFNQQDHAFSDFQTGWAFFNRDQALRHNSNGSGPSYGARVNSPGVIEVICDTKNGNLKFILNGQDYGNAYSGEQSMCDGNLYPALASLSNGGSVTILETTMTDA